MNMALRVASLHGAEQHQTEREMKKLFVRFLKDQSGVTAIEYGLIAGLISVVILGSVTLIGTSI